MLEALVFGGLGLFFLIFLPLLLIGLLLKGLFLILLLPFRLLGLVFGLAAGAAGLALKLVFGLFLLLLLPLALAAFAVAIPLLPLLLLFGGLWLVFRATRPRRRTVPA